uniref:Uncharacterized protein n=1 Tax=Palpitomonas bilix TaxID=652834 RepID=A0A7S3DC34_9EUKA
MFLVTFLNFVFFFFLVLGTALYILFRFVPLSGIILEDIERTTLCALGCDVECFPSPDVIVIDHKSYVVQGSCEQNFLRHGQNTSLRCNVPAGGFSSLDKIGKRLQNESILLKYCCASKPSYDFVSIYSSAGAAFGFVNLLIKMLDKGVSISFSTLTMCKCGKVLMTASLWSKCSRAVKAKKEKLVGKITGAEGESEASANFRKYELQELEIERPPGTTGSP